MREFLKRVDDVRWELSMSAMSGMKVPGMIYGDNYILENLEKENALQQIANVACLPGISGYSFAMPDVHWGYGFPIGGVAAFDLEEGIISPGGVGYDISCGVRLMTSSMGEDEVREQLEPLTAALFANVPCGVGSRGKIRLSERDMDKVLQYGASWAVRKGLGTENDLQHIEENGVLSGANPDAVSLKARERGKDQLGTLGSGNHFLEVQVVDKIFDGDAARSFGLSEGQVAVMIHCGSRGLGHQVCDDHIRLMNSTMKKYGIPVPDRQLCCVPIRSEEGKNYLEAMWSAANFALANREVIGSMVRDVFTTLFPSHELRLLYDVSHNMAHIEEFPYGEGRKSFCVHRKGATRALPPGHSNLSGPFQKTGQPVIIPGSMGTASYILLGTSIAEEQCFSSTCHGAGRLMSRHAARKNIRGEEIKREMKSRGIYVMADSYRTLCEEIPQAYKDVDSVVDVVSRAGISSKVARMKPIAVIKG